MLLQGRNACAAVLDIADAWRGFCKISRSSPFYQPIGANHARIAAGCLDLLRGMTPAKHIFTADAGEYDTIPDDARHIPD